MQSASAPGSCRRQAAERGSSKNHRHRRTRRLKPPLPFSELSAYHDAVVLLKVLRTESTATQQAVRVTARSLIDVTQHGFTLWSSIESGNSLMLLRCS